MENIYESITIPPTQLHKDMALDSPSSRGSGNTPDGPRGLPRGPKGHSRTALSFLAWEVAWTNDGVTNHNRKCGKKEEEWVGRNESQSSLASLGLQWPECPQVETPSQDLALYGANTWGRGFSEGVGVGDSTEPSKPWCGWGGSSILCVLRRGHPDSHGGSDTQAPELHSSHPKCDPKWSCLPPSRGYCWVTVKSLAEIPCHVNAVWRCSHCFPWGLETALRVSHVKLAAVWERCSRQCRGPTWWPLYSNP